MNQETLKKIRPYITKVRRKFTTRPNIVISVDVENKDFAVIVTEEAYELGAKEVVLNWRCSPIARQRLLHANESVLENLLTGFLNFTNSISMIRQHFIFNQC